MSKLIPLANFRGYAIVDDEDYGWLIQYRWHYSAGYATRAERQNKRPVNIRMHRMIARPPDDMHTHHRNHDGLDNRRENLQIVTVAEHSRLNRPKRSGYKRWRPPPYGDES